MSASTTAVISIRPSLAGQLLTSSLCVTFSLLQLLSPPHRQLSPRPRRLSYHVVQSPDTVAPVKATLGMFIKAAVRRPHLGLQLNYSWGSLPPAELPCPHSVALGRFAGQLPHVSTELHLSVPKTLSLGKPGIPKSQAQLGGLLPSRATPGHT